MFAIHQFLNSVVEPDAAVKGLERPEMGAAGVKV
jgi:hypothetical protein